MIHTMIGASFFSFLLFFGVGMLLLAIAYVIRFWKGIKRDPFPIYMSIGYATCETTIALCVLYIVVQHGWGWFLWQWGTGLALALLAFIGVYLAARWASRKCGGPMKFLEG